MSVCSFSIAKDFSRYPGGRLRVRGPYSGEEFRDDFLIPRLNEFEVLEIDLDGVVGYPPSFIDESFGELAKRMGLEEMKRRFHFKSEDDPFIVKIIWSKIEKGAREA